MKKHLIDSNIIIESFKENSDAVSLLEKLKKDCFICINPIIVSEVAYILKKKLHCDILQIIDILSGFIILQIGNEVVKIAYDYMQKYNMKPNDAIIAATCTFHKIPNILSLDNDFNEVCKNENINLII
ncbi:MAG: PIN domain-containing protein [Bacteroidales bacterium]|nr:PIN domain-containing protein [Bacteroidales bacterium]